MWCLVCVVLISSNTVLASQEQGCGRGETVSMVQDSQLEGCPVQGEEHGLVALVLGASGETGKKVLKYLVESPEYSSIISLGRRELVLPSDGLYNKVVQKIVDFDNLELHAAEFIGVDQAFCCLGTTRAVSGAEGFVKVDHDYVLRAAEILKSSNCPDFHLLTSKGSNAGSWFLYPSTKGKIENAVAELGFDHLSIYRPGLLLCERETGRFLESVLQSLARYTDTSTWWWSVPTEMVARAMVTNSVKADRETMEIIEHDQIVKIAQQS